MCHLCTTPVKLVRIVYILCSLWMIVCAFSVSHTSELSASEANLAVSACPLRDRLWSVPPLIQLSISKILSPGCKTKLRRPLNYGGPEIMAAPKLWRLLNCGGPETMAAPKDPLSETMQRGADS